jgi:hypothetical protein
MSVGSLGCIGADFDPIANHRDPMFDNALVLLVIADLLVAVGISQPLAIRLRLPPSVLLAAVGVAIGALPVVLGRLGLSGPGTLLISSPFS